MLTPTPTIRIPTRLIVFLGLLPQESPAPAVGKVFCAHCEQLQHGNAADKRLHAEATHNSSDGRVFLGYHIGELILTRISRGRDRGKWMAIKEGGIFCENGHYTGIRNGQLFHVAAVHLTSCSIASALKQFHCKSEAI